MIVITRRGKERRGRKWSADVSRKEKEDRALLLTRRELSSSLLDFRTLPALDLVNDDSSNVDRSCNRLVDMLERERSRSDVGRESILDEFAGLLRVRSGHRRERRSGECRYRSVVEFVRGGGGVVRKAGETKRTTA